MAKHTSSLLSAHRIKLPIVQFTVAPGGALTRNGVPMVTPGGIWTCSCWPSGVVIAIRSQELQPSRQTTCICCCIPATGEGAAQTSRAASGAGLGTAIGAGLGTPIGAGLGVDDTSAAGGAEAAV